MSNAMPGPTLRAVDLMGGIVFHLMMLHSRLAALLTAQEFKC